MAELGDGAVVVDDVPAALVHERVAVKRVDLLGHGCLAGAHGEQEAGVLAGRAERELGEEAAGLDLHQLDGAEKRQVRQVQFEAARGVSVHAQLVSLLSRRRQLDGLFP